MVKVPPCNSSRRILFSEGGAEVADLLFDLGEAHELCVAENRHDEAFAAAHGDTDVVVVLVNDVRFADLCVDLRDLLEPSTTALTKNDMKPSLTPYFSW